jgi:hypothetical protein
MRAPLVALSLSVIHNLPPILRLAFLYPQMGHNFALRSNKEIVMIKALVVILPTADD